MEVRKIQKSSSFSLLLSITVIFTFVGLPSTSWAEIAVSNATINLSPMASIPSAGYMTIQNKSRKEVSIQSISSPAFEDVSWHETFVSEEGIARMRMKKKATVIPAFGEVVLKKGGQHLMLYAALKELEKERNKTEDEMYEV